MMDRVRTTLLSSPSFRPPNKLASEEQMAAVVSYASLPDNLILISGKLGNREGPEGLFVCLSVCLTI
jgi:hypothetical protein